MTSDSGSSSSAEDEYLDTDDFEELSKLQLQLEKAACEILTVSTATLNDAVERADSPSPYERIAEVSCYFWPFSLETDLFSPLGIY